MGARTSKEEGSGGSAALAPELMARVRRIQIKTHRLVSSVLAGAYRSTFRGTGIEFEDLREYMPGDDVRNIDWKVTARTGDPFVKTYVEDRQLTLMFLVDTSHSMDFGSRAVTKREMAAEFCALLAYVAVFQQDQVGLCLFADEPGLHLEPRKGNKHVQRVVREVIAAPPGGRGSSLASVLEHQARVLRRRSMVFVVSDFVDNSASDGRGGDDWSEICARLALRHDVIAVRVTDPLEEELPAAGILTLADIESGARVEVDTRSAAVRAHWEAEARRRRDRLTAALQKGRAELIELSTAGNVADPVVRYFQTRTRRRAGGRA